MAFNIDPKERRLIELETELRLTKEQAQRGECGTAWLMTTLFHTGPKARAGISSPTSTLDQRLSSLEACVQNVKQNGCIDTGGIDWRTPDIFTIVSPVLTEESQLLKDLRNEVKRLSTELAKTEKESKAALEKSERSMRKYTRAQKRLKRRNDLLRRRLPCALPPTPGYSSSSGTPALCMPLRNRSHIKDEEPMSRQGGQVVGAPNLPKFDPTLTSKYVKQEQVNDSPLSQNDHFGTGNDMETKLKLGEYLKSSLHLSSTKPKYHEGAPELEYLPSAATTVSSIPDVCDDVRLPPHDRPTHKHRAPMNVRGNGCTSPYSIANFGSTLPAPPPPSLASGSLSREAVPRIPSRLLSPFKLEGTQDRFGDYSLYLPPVPENFGPDGPVLYNPAVASLLPRAPRAYGPRRSDKNYFCDAKYRRLMGVATFVEDMEVDEYAGYWYQYQDEHIEHSDEEWREYYERAVRPAFYAKQDFRESPGVVGPGGDVRGMEAAGKKAEVADAEHHELGDEMVETSHGIVMGNGEVMLGGSGEGTSPAPDNNDLVHFGEEAEKAPNTSIDAAYPEEDEVAYEKGADEDVLVPGVAAAAKPTPGVTPANGEAILDMSDQDGIIDPVYCPVSATEKVLAKAQRENIDTRNSQRFTGRFRHRKRFSVPAFTPVLETHPADRLTVAITNIHVSVSLSAVLNALKSDDILRATYIDTSKMRTIPPLPEHTRTVLVVFICSSAAESVVSTHTKAPGPMFTLAPGYTEGTLATLRLLETATYLSRPECAILSALRSGQSQLVSRFVAISGYATSVGAQNTGFNLHGAYQHLHYRLPQLLTVREVREAKGEVVWVLEFAGLVEAERALGCLRWATMPGGVFEGCGVGSWVVWDEGVGEMVVVGEKEGIGGVDRGNEDGEHGECGQGDEGVVPEPKGFTFRDGTTLKEWFAKK